MSALGPTQGPLQVGGNGPGQVDKAHATLRQAADALNGMFLRQLFSAMRATVPDADGAGSAGGSLFTEMLDDTLADHAATQMRTGLGEAIYRQLCQRLDSNRNSTP